MTERSELAALGAIVTALAIVALGRLGPPAPAKATDAPSGAGIVERKHTRPLGSALAALREGRPVDLNCADAATLELLPGVGHALAQRIVEHRAAAGPFPSLDALDAVRGVGPKTLARVLPLLSIGLSCPASTTPKR